MDTIFDIFYDLIVVCLFIGFALPIIIGIGFAIYYGVLYFLA